MPDVYPLLDVLAVPSVAVPGWVEQFGRVVVEAQAAGVPVVASASGALPEVVGDRGLLVPEGDPAALAEALGRFLDEPGLWSRLRDAGVRDAWRFSWAQVAADQLALYGRAASGGSRRGSPHGCRAQRPVELLETVEVQREGEPLLLARPGGRAPVRRRSSVSSASSTSARAAAGASPGGKRLPASPTVSRWAPPPAATTGKPAGHGLDHREAEGLCRRGGEEDRGAGEQRIGVGDLPGEGHARRAPELVGELLELGAQRPGPGDDQTSIPRRRARCTPTPGGRPRGPSPGPAVGASPRSAPRAWPADDRAPRWG